jgi:hypothetical protein
MNAANRDLVRFSSWVRSALFHGYLRRFVILWAAGKGANAFTAFLAGLPAPWAFRPLTEIGICAIELGILALFIRQANEDILLGNIGLRPSVALVPLVPLHFVLSGVVALLVR